MCVLIKTNTKQRLLERLDFHFFIKYVEYVVPDPIKNPDLV